MRQWKKVLRSTMALGLALALTACGSAGSSQSSTAGGKDAKAEASGDLPVLRVAMMPFITSLPTEYIRKRISWMRRPDLKWIPSCLQQVLP